MPRILIGNIKGPQGAQGIQGPQGPVGATGPRGPMPDLINNALATEAGVAALDAAMGKTLQDQLTELNSNMSMLTVLEDNLDFDQLKTSGWYSLYSDINAPQSTYKARWIVRVDRIADTIQEYIVQKAYYYMGGEYSLPQERHTYINQNSQYSWSEWI